MYLLILKKLEFLLGILFQNNKQFFFNYFKIVQIEGSKYFNELKIAARKPTKCFCIWYTNLSAKEFCEVISAGKKCPSLCFYYDLIVFDEERNFGKDMNRWKIETLSFTFSGSSIYSDWSQNPQRFENMVSAISKCVPLLKSKKDIRIESCSLSKEKAEEVMNKYNLSGIKITGV